MFDRWIRATSAATWIQRGELTLLGSDQRVNGNISFLKGTEARMAEYSLGMSVNDLREETKLEGLGVVFERAEEI